MYHLRISSPAYTPQRKKRHTNSGKSLIGSVHNDEEKTTITTSTEWEEPVPIRYSDSYKQKKGQIEMGNMFKKKKSYPIAPDALIPNSSFRTVFKRKEIKPIIPKAFQLRLDILNNLQVDNKNWQDDDDEWTELDDPDMPTKSSSTRKNEGTLVSRQKFNDDDLFSDDEINNIYWTKDTIPDLFKRMQNESWWKQVKDDKPNFRSMVLYLIEILKLKQIDSYESACGYIIEIFRTYGLDPVFVNQMLEILLDHLTKSEDDHLDISTLRTIGQFMIERKDIIIHLLEYALKCQSNDTLRLEVINTIKYITDVNNSEEIDLVLENISVVYDTPDDDFSLKMIIKGLENKKKIVQSDENNDEEEEQPEEIHPLLKKISEERWFPRGQFSITLDYVLESIIKKLPDGTKTMVKTLTTHLIQLHRIIGYLKEQFDRVSNALISLLSHSDPDYRLIAATTLANLDKETKDIDIALLNSFLNDPRILVRTECCDSLKKLTGIMSDTVLKDCADDISYLQTLPEENFTLQNYLNEKNRVPTPPVEEDIIPRGEVELNEDIRSPSPPQIIEQPAVINTLPLPIQPELIEFSIEPSVTSVEPSIRIEMNEKQSSPKIEQERTSIQTTRQNKQSISPTKPSLPNQMNRKHISHLPTNTNMWDSFDKQSSSENTDQKDSIVSEMNYFPVPQSTLVDQEQTNDPIQTIIEEHKQTVGYYRLIPPRRVLIPHKISMDNVFAEQSHMIIINHSSSQSLMNLSDLNHNQYQLNEVEYIQLLSSLVIRAIQVHRQCEKFLPGTNSPSFENALSVSQIQLHSSSNFQQSSINSSLRLPVIGHQRPTSKQLTCIQTNIQAKATREGINVHKAQNMESALSNVLRTNREQTRSTILSSSIIYPSSSSENDVTHAWLLSELLKSQGIYNSEYYLQKIIQAYPKFIPLLHTRISRNLVAIVWNDPVMKQLAAIFSNKRDQSSMANSSMKRSDTKPSVPTTDDEYSFNGFEYSTFVTRDEQKKKYLPPIRGSKINVPRHVVKFGYRQIETDSSELSNFSPRDENRSKPRRRRVQMHLMISANENTFDRHGSIKSQVRHMVKTDYQTTSYVPIVARAPMCLS